LYGLSCPLQGQLSTRLTLAYGDNLAQLPNGLASHNDPSLLSHPDDVLSGHLVSPRFCGPGFLGSYLIPRAMMISMVFHRSPHWQA
jgi:hypothetical protein